VINCAEMSTVCPRCYKTYRYLPRINPEESCKCVAAAEVKVYPRPCPCPNQDCQDEWAAGTKDEEEDDDTDYIVEHCACHEIAVSDTSFHCEDCGVWVCQDCANLKELPYIIDDSDDELLADDTRVICQSCKIRWYQYLVTRLALRVTAAQETLKNMKERLAAESLVGAQTAQ